MLTSIGSPGQKRGGDDLTSSLLDCHERIRRFSKLAVRLAQAEAGDPAEQIAEAAAGVRRYFTVALPLHSADEERSIEPRLVVVRPELGETFAKMAREHRQLEALIEELEPSWRRLIDEPARHAEEAARLLGPSERLEALFAIHLVPEETVVFPALASLAPEERALALGELRARRQR
ncbi:MAG TPA: hemerythrin domain-containing protein [Polyangia bacterium]|jgi:hemerythrin-like domain-containing protein